MSEVAGDRSAAISVGTRQEAAAYAAIGAGGAHGRGLGGGRIHGGALQRFDVTAANRAQTASPCPFPNAVRLSEPATLSCMAITEWLSMPRRGLRAFGRTRGRCVTARSMIP